MVEFKIVRTAKRVNSLLSTLESGKQTLASLWIFLMEYHGIKVWREKEPKKAG